MRRLIAWIGGAAGGIAAYRFVRRQEASLQTSPETSDPEQDARAEELRAKLAESRAADEPWTAEPRRPGGGAGVARGTPRRVHEEGRAALDEMSPWRTNRASSPCRRNLPRRRSPTRQSRAA